MAGADDNKPSENGSGDVYIEEVVDDQNEETVCEDFMTFPEYDVLNNKLDELIEALDILEQQNDDIHKRLEELLQSNRDIRQELKQENMKSNQDKLH